jgi:ornithine decarboxylase
MASVVASDLLVREDYRMAEPVVSFDEARDLIDRFGGPLVVFAPSVLRRNFETMTRYLPGVEFFYAIKANPDKIVLRTLQAAGCSADVCTARELRWAKEAGFTTDRMIHTHPCKRPADIDECYAGGVRWFTFDSPFELPKLAAGAPDAKLLLRLAAPGSSSIIDLSSKFGASPLDATDLILQARSQGLRVGGLSFHVGSQCTAPDDFVPALQAARAIWDEAERLGCPLEVLDIGGGFPAPYRGAVLTLEAYCGMLNAALEDIFGDVRARVIAEPGRGLVAESATLISTVVGKSMRNGTPWYFLDDGIYGSFSGKAFDHADFPLLVEGIHHREVTPCVVAGPTCDSGDVISRDQLLPELEVGEIVLVPTMGAYSTASATDFNGLERAQTLSLE